MQKVFKVLIFTDLDGSLLHRDTFKFEEIKNYLIQLISKGIFIIPNSSKTDKEIIEFNKAVTHVADMMGSKSKGYRALTNIGSDGGQEVPHLHYHIFSGEKIGKMVS